jgi:hypothetical protein
MQSGLSQNFSGVLLQVIQCWQSCLLQARSYQQLAPQLGKQ